MEKLSLPANFLLLSQIFLQYGQVCTLVGLGIFFFSVVLESLYTALCGTSSRSHIQKCENV